MNYFFNRLLFVLSFLLSFVLTPITSFALPEIQSISEGQATVSQSSNTTTITQTSNQTTINWNSFNINTNESVTFNQPSASAIAINHILDQNPSQILGSITANGRIVLLNANGFYFGANSSVSANTFIVAATSLTNTTYNSTTNTLTIINPSLITATIDARGSIITTKTQLIAKTITQQGTISSTPHGSISIRATNNITIQGTITSPQGTIDIFATNGTATATPTASITTTTANYDSNQPAGFIEFSGKIIDLQAQPFTLNSQDTLLLDPDYIQIIGGAQPATCPAAVNQCGFDSGSQITDTTDTNGATAGLGTTYIYEDTLEAVSSGTIILSALKGISMSGTFTSGLTLASGVNLSLATTCTDSVCTSTNDNINISQAITAQGTGTIRISSGSDLFILANLDANSVTISASDNIYSHRSSFSYQLNNINVVSGANLQFLFVITGNQIMVGDSLISSGISYKVLSATEPYFVADVTFQGVTLLTNPNLTRPSFYQIVRQISGSSITTSSTGTLTIGSSSTDNIGNIASPIIINTNSSGWSSSNLILNSVASGNIYLRSANTGLTDATINTFSSGTLSLKQTSGSFAISSALTFSNATLELISSNDIALGASITATSVTLNAGTSITRSAGAITSGTSGTISLTATAGSIGTASNAITIAGATSWSTNNLTLSASTGNIYLQSSATTFGATISNFSTGTFSLVQTSGNLTLASALNLPSATIRLSTSGATTNIDLGTYAITATSIYLNAIGNITGTGTLTIASTGTLTLASNSASIGTANQPITIAGASAWSTSNLTLAAQNFYLRSSATAFGATISNFSTGTFSLVQTSGNLTLASALNLPSATIRLTTSGANANIDLGANANIDLDANVITATSIYLTATGNIIGTGTLTIASTGTPTLSLISSSGSIGTANQPITIAGASAWSTSNLTLAAQNFYLRSSATAFGATISNFSTGTFSLVQTSGNLTLASALNLPSATIRLTTSGANANIDLGANAITATSIYLTATGNIIGTGTLTIASTGTLTLASNSASIGTANQPITIAGASAWSTSNLTLAAQNFYLQSSATAFGATISNFSTGTFSLVQTSGNLTLASALNLSSATIRLTTSGANANIDLGANAITATSIYLTAAGNIIGTGTLTIGTSGSLNVTSSSGSIGTASNAIAIARTSGIWASTNLILSATNGSIYIKTATSDALAALSAASFRLLATGTFFLEQTAGTLTLASALTFPTATIIIKNNGAIQFNASASITAAAITLSATSFTTANHSAYHLRAPSLSITSSAGDIASETSKLVISSASSEVPDFTSLVVRTPTSNKAYLIRLGTKDTATNALNLIKQSTSPNGTIIFYDQINPTQLLATTSSATKKKQYEGFVSQLLFNLLGSLGADCSKTGLLASLIAKPLCSLKL